MSGWIKLEKDRRDDPRVRFKRSRMPAARKRELAIRYGCDRGEACTAECHWCGDEGRIRWPSWALDPIFDHTIDHVLPLSRGGTHALDNLVLACGFCNSSRSAKTVEEWLAA